MANDYLYSELKEYCSGDLQEMKDTIEYFMERLKQEIESEKLENDR